MSLPSARAEPTLANAAEANGNSEEFLKVTMMYSYLQSQSRTVRQTPVPCVTATPKASVLREGNTKKIFTPTPREAAFSSEEDF